MRRAYIAISILGFVGILGFVSWLLIDATNRLPRNDETIMFRARDPNGYIYVHELKTDDGTFYITHGTNSIHTLKVK